MKQLDTIQTQEKLNNVYAVDEVGPGLANYVYRITNTEGDTTYLDLFFQKGARKEAGSQHGVIDSDLLEIVRHRLAVFQEGPYASKHNEEALHHIECALKAMNQRVEDRISRNVLGTYNK